MPMDSLTLTLTGNTVTPLSSTRKKVSWALITCEQTNAEQIRVIGRSQARAAGADGALITPAPTSGGKLLANGETMILPALGNAQPYDLSDVYVIAEGSGNSSKVSVVYGSN